MCVCVVMLYKKTKRTPSSTIQEINKQTNTPPPPFQQAYNTNHSRTLIVSPSLIPYLTSPPSSIVRIPYRQGSLPPPSHPSLPSRPLKSTSTSPRAHGPRAASVTPPPAPEATVRRFLRGAFSRTKDMSSSSFRGWSWMRSRTWRLVSHLLLTW